MVALKDRVSKDQEIPKPKDGYDYFFEHGGVESESYITLKSTNKDDFENLKDDLKLGEALNLRPIDVTMENIQKIAEASKLFMNNRDGKAPLDSFKLPFLDEEKSNFQIFGGGGVEETTLKSLHMGGLTLDEDKFEIKMRIEHYSYDPVTKEKNDYVKDTIKDIAKKNNSELEFEHNLYSEEFYYKMGKATSLIYGEKENFDIQGNSKYYSLEYYPDDTGKSIKEERGDYKITLIGESEILKKEQQEKEKIFLEEQQKKEQEAEKHNTIYDELEPINNNNAFTKVLFTATNELDFENLKESLQLKKTFGAEHLEKITMYNIESYAESQDYRNDVEFKEVNRHKLHFLEEDKYREWTPGKDDGPKEFILEQPHFKLYNEKYELNIKIDDEKFTLNLHLDDTHMLGHKFASKNEYIKNTIKDIAKENNCELLFVHSEERFADRVGETYTLNEMKKFDKDGKDITPLEEQANSKSFKELLKEINFDSFKDLAKDVIKRVGEDYNNPVTPLGEIKKDVEKVKAIFKPKVKQQSKNQDMER